MGFPPKPELETTESVGEVALFLLAHQTSWRVGTMQDRRTAFFA